MFEIAMNNQMQIATNQMISATGTLCGFATCGNRGDMECVNLDNAAMVNGDYLSIEGAFSRNAAGGRYFRVILQYHINKYVGL